MSPSFVSKALESEWSRRRFFQVASAASASALTAHGLWGAEPGGDRRVRVGFLGTGYSHFASKYALLRDSPEFELGPAGANWMPAEALFRAAEVVVVESAVRHHARDAQRALEAGCHVHLEKPPAASIGEFQSLVDLARRKGRLLQIGYMWRYNPGLNTVLDAARNGWLGELFLVRAVINTEGDAGRRREWAEFPGGILFELGGHLVDPIIRLLGTPDRIESTLQRTRSPADTLMDNAAVVFGFGKVLAVLTCAALQTGAGAHRGFEIQGSRGIARVQPLESPVVTLDLTEAAGPYPKGRSEIPMPPYTRYVDEFRALAAALRRGSPLPVSLETELQIEAALLKSCQM